MYILENIHVTTMRRRYIVPDTSSCTKDHQVFYHSTTAIPRDNISLHWKVSNDVADNLPSDPDSSTILYPLYAFQLTQRVWPTYLFS